MKKKGKVYSIVLASTMMILFLVLVSSMALASPKYDPRNAAIPDITNGAGDPSDDKVQYDELSTKGNGIATESIQAAAPNITETQITTNESDQWSPDIYGNRIVWQDWRNGNYDIYMYDLSTKKETQITNNTWDQYSPSIYGDRIVWVDYRNGNGDIYMYNVSTSKETRITSNVSEQYSPKIYGNRIVWVDYRDVNEGNWNTNIYMYDLSTNKETQITTNASEQYSPAIYGDKIVWEDYRNGNGDIYMYNVSTSKETRITTNASDQYSPRIYGNRIVWVDYRNANEGSWNPNIYMYDLSTNKETQITTNPSASYSPAIYGDRIVWMDDRNGNWDIYVYDLATGQETHTTDKSDQYYPNIYRDKIVWTDMRNRNPDIYMGALSSAAFSAKPTEGIAPLNVTFTDESTGNPTKWKWTFGDGTSSTIQNPTHKYSKVGSYTVTLTATNADGSNTVTKTGYIKAVTKPVANFTGNVTSGKAPLTVAFTDKSAGIPTSWNWTFGDGTNSTEQSPQHQYLQEENYTVKLTVKNVAGNNTSTKTNYIKLTTNTRPGPYSINK